MQEGFEDFGDGALLLEEGIVAEERRDADEGAVRNGLCQRFDVGGRHKLIAVFWHQGGGYGDRARIDAVQVDGLRQAPISGGAYARAVLFAHVIQVVL